MTLRQAAIATAALAVLMLTAGCHKNTRVSRRAAPPPPRSQRRSAERNPSTTARRVPPVTIPGSDNPNLPNAGRGGSVEVGMASWYAPSGHRSANGESYDGNSLTAAHRTLPMGTLIRVTNLSTNQSATVRVTDRGPFVRGRVLDLSTAAAKATGVYRMGVAQVRIEVVQPGTGVALGGRWCVQVGAFADEDNAALLKADLLRRYSTSAKVIEFPGATGYWVRLNPVGGDRAQAMAIAQSLRPSEAAAQAWLVRLD